MGFAISSKDNGLETDYGVEGKYFDLQMAAVSNVDAQLMFGVWVDKKSKNAGKAAVAQVQITLTEDDWAAVLEQTDVMNILMTACADYLGSALPEETGALKADH